MVKFPMTAEGHALLENELKHRQQVERPRIIQQLADDRKQTRAVLQSLRTNSRAPKSSTLLSYPGTSSNLAPRSP
jgi:hypothetical protein